MGDEDLGQINTNWREEMKRETGWREANSQRQ